jgi:gliding motility-associated-like protein
MSFRFCLLLFAFLLSAGHFTYAADYYWVGGNGNWSDINKWATTSGGNIKHIVVPSPADNVFFDANSFNAPNQQVTIDAGIATCRNFTIGNVADTPRFTGMNQLRVYGSMTLSRKALWQYTGKVSFEAVTTGHQITTDSIVFLNEVWFAGLGGSWILMDRLKVNQRVYLEYGSLNTSGKTLECTGFFSTSTNVRSLTLGTSTLIISSYWSVNMQNLSLSAAQSKILFSGGATFSSLGTPGGNYNLVYFNATGMASSTLSTTAASFASVRFAGNGFINGNNTFDTLFFSPGFEYSATAISTVNKKLDANGDCVSMITIIGLWNLNMPASANFLANFCKISYVMAAGGNPFVSNGSKDVGGNSGITFVAAIPLNLYWVGGSGQWNDTAHWSYNSGGPGGACIPTDIDNVWFDANSFILGDSVVIIDDQAECHDMHWINIPDSIRLVKSEDLFIHGSVWLHHNLTWVGATSQTHFVSNQSGETITSDGVALTGPVYFDGIGSWTLLDDFEVDGHGVDHKLGTWNTNGKTVKVFVYHSFSGNNRTLNLGSSHFIVTSSHVQAWTLMALNYTLNAGTSTVDLAAPNIGMYNTSSFGISFYNVIFSDSTGLGQLNTDANNFHSLTFNSNGFIRGNNTMGTLNLTKGKDYSLAYNNAQMILTALNAVGGCDGYILIHSDEKDYPTSLGKASGVVNCEYLIMWNVHAIGGATFNAFSSVDLGNNIGWNFTQPAAKSLYWVGGTGNWSDVNHWSLTSGGPGGACVPSPLDSVFFDLNSFLNPFDTVYVDLTNATCHTMTWKDTLQGAVLTGDELNAMWFWGSVIFDTTMTNEFLGYTYLEAPDTGHILVSANNWFNNKMTIEGRGGSWQVIDSLNVLKSIVFKHGALLAPGKLVQTGSLNGNIASQRTLDISNATVNILGSASAWELNHDSLSFLAAGSFIEFKSPGFVDFNNYAQLPAIVLFHDIRFSHYFSTAVMWTGNILPEINVAWLDGNANFNANFLYDSLMLSQGHTYRFTSGTTQSFNHITATGTCFHPIIFTRMTPAGAQYYLQNLTSSAQVNYVTMDGCAGMTPSTYLATNSTDNGANTNWTITPVGPVDLYWVNGTGNWWDPYHWSYSSGGTGGACIPTFRDNVFFDQNSFLTAQDTVTVDSTFAECHNKQWINIYGNPTFFLDQYKPLNIYGSLRLDTAMNGIFRGYIRFVSNHTGNFIYCGSQVFNDSVVFHGTGGAWTLYDSLTAINWVNLIRGHLNTNGQTLSANIFLSITTNQRQLTLGASTLRIRSLWRVVGTNLTLSSGTSNIRMALGGARFMSENGPGLNYHNLWMDATLGTCTLQCNNIPVTYNKVTINNNGIIYGEHIFDSLLMMPGNLYQLEKGKTQQINSYWLLRGNNCFPLTLQSTQFGQQATVTKSSGQVICDFINVRDINATGGATYFAGDNSTNVSNNTGWNFSNSPGYIFGLGPDIEFTIGSTITLSTANFNGGPGTTYLWSTGATTPSIIVNQPDTYSVTVTYAGNCVVVDTIIVFCNVKPSYTIGDCICFGDSNGWINMTISDTVGTYKAYWSHGDTLQNVTGLPAGQYIVIIKGSTGCNGRDTLWVGEPPPVIVPLNDTSFCEDDTGVLLDASPAFVNYWWNGQPGPQSLYVTQADTIIIVVEDADGCRSAPDTVVITIDTIPYIWLGDDAEICLGEVVYLSPGTGFHQYLWQDGSNNHTFVATQGGDYYVTIRLRTCYNHDTIILTDCPPEIIFPNVFTPNGDGFNDYFYPIHQNIINYRLVVYSRWGNPVFITSDLYERWDGSANGFPCPDGTYFFTVDYEGFGQRASKGRKIHRGIVTILR